jgi:rhamnogalacturonyl hydrolase YesR
MKKIFLILSFVIAAIPTMAASSAKGKTNPVVNIIKKVNLHWQTEHSPEVRAFWDNAVYFTGNMEAYKLTGVKTFLDYSKRWCQYNHWQGATETDPSKWLYRQYGEDQQHVLFGDWQICFQTYIDMYSINRDETMIRRAKEVIDHVCTMSEHDFWWWADALYMAMPVYSKLYKISGDTKYLDKMYDNFCFSDSLMYDKDVHMYYRDGKYLYPAHKTINGKKDFWARGDGWVLAGLAKVLSDMPKNYKHRALFVNRFKALAAAAAKCQQDEGYWTRSMLDPDQSEGPETSGTALLTFGILRGVNSGILSKETYKPIIDRAWKYLTQKALQSDGSIGYVQPIGEKAIHGQQLTPQSTSNFGVGAFLLAACEKVRYDRKSKGAK